MISLNVPKGQKWPSIMPFGVHNSFNFLGTSLGKPSGLLSQLLFTAETDNNECKPFVASSFMTVSLVHNNSAEHYVTHALNKNNESLTF